MPVPIVNMGIDKAYNFVKLSYLSVLSNYEAFIISTMTIIHTFLYFTGALKMIYTVRYIRNITLFSVYFKCHISIQFRSKYLITCCELMTTKWHPFLIIGKSKLV